MEAQKKILVVDDDLTVVTLLQSVLVSQGREVLTAMDGEEGLENIKILGRILLFWIF